VWQLVLCGMLFLLRLVFVGLCLAPSKSYLRVGGRVAVRGVPLCGKWSLIVLCGVFGVKETIDALRTRRGLERSSSISFFLLFTLGPWAGLPRGVLAFQIFFPISLLLPSPSCILPVY
jgi:hypothetical protein